MSTLYEKIKNAYDEGETYGKLNTNDYPWVSNFTKECPDCHGEVSVFFTDPEHLWAESKCESCGKVITPDIEVPDDEEDSEVIDRTDEEDSDTNYFEVYIEDGNQSGVVAIYKDGSKWYEKVVDGNLDRSIFTKTYQGYLTKLDIMTWLRQDNFDSIKLLESNKLTEADTNYNTIVNDIVKAFMPYVDKFEFKDMRFEFEFKKFDKETVEAIQEKYKEDLGELRNTLSREGLNLEVSDQTVIISSK